MISKNRATQTILDMTFACVIEEYSKLYYTPLDEAARLFYSSRLIGKLEEGVADLHCRSFIYLADELRLEVVGYL